MRDELLYDYEEKIKQEALAAEAEQQDHEVQVDEEQKPEQHKKWPKSLKISIAVCIIAVIIITIIVSLLPKKYGRVKITIYSLQDDEFSYYMSERYPEFTKNEYAKLDSKSKSKENAFEFLYGLTNVSGTRIFHNEKNTMYIVVRHPNAVTVDLDSYCYKYSKPTGEVNGYKYYVDYGKGWFRNYYFTNGEYETLITFFDKGCNLDDADAIAKDIMSSYTMPALSGSDVAMNYNCKYCNFVIPEGFAIDRGSYKMFSFDVVKDDDDANIKYDPFDKMQDYPNPDYLDVLLSGCRGKDMLNEKLSTAMEDFNKISLYKYPIDPKNPVYINLYYEECPMVVYEDDEIIYEAYEYSDNLYYGDGYSTWEELGTYVEQAMYRYVIGWIRNLSKEEKTINGKEVHYYYCDEEKVNGYDNYYMTKNSVSLYVFSRGAEHYLSIVGKGFDSSNVKYLESLVESVE